MVSDDVKVVMAQVLNVDVQKLNDDASPLTIPEWDSLKHMNLILALEEKFGIRFRDDQIVDLLNVKLIVLAVEELQHG